MGGTQFRVLGPLEVEHAGDAVRVGGLRQRILLTLLALEADRAVPVPRLIDGIWGERPPASAKGQVWICVSGLRRRLAETGAGEVVETRPSGYALRAGRDALDLLRFRDLVAHGRHAAREGRAEEAVGLLRAGAEQWRGPVGAGLDSALLDSAAVRLEEERVAAAEECFDLELGLGRHHGIVGELMGHVAEHPFRERLCAQLMLALYHSGRRADALRVYRDVRVRYTDELGLEPGEKLRALECAILGERAVRPIPLIRTGNAIGARKRVDRTPSHAHSTSVPVLEQEKEWQTN
ncbi:MULTISPECIES: AfsR/SARP family transcriptional regulator [unclassified Streptomyces]|uniref:AfsR/SARP family transcriptional regulator n=1 Tax=unclassified Streptomyces TaxID=2593676 RepID=UPI002DD9EC70|nr:MULTISPECIES: AfsR/SARP family transcriptional regulator [unclassified Streptomyces]WSA91212.1 AfsR/SARP family transcriptional regulator [Streptomyces sp. NBC_01795]WSS16179.1 AfsR/SARP family transcriptional regulator [Streptomyces sp. NBC_01186]WSS44998.1 AfsR/SARP family transcriptional regulator [Streptomyces sp. NBC_01187]